jgi:hypothetical protein
MAHKALNRILQLSNKNRRGKKKETRMKATSGWFDNDVYYIFLLRNVFFSLFQGWNLFLPLLLLVQKDNAFYGETDKVAAGTNAARALRSLSLVLRSTRSIVGGHTVLFYFILSRQNIKTFSR